MNPNEMSLEECRAWLLERDGWKHHPADTELRECWERGLARVFRNPMPLSLDAIYAAMPRGKWSWLVTFDKGFFTGRAWTSWKEVGVVDPNARDVTVTAPDRLTCEARLCVALWLADAAR